MATIRTYTTIEQSKKLTEILPLESADMCWQYQKDRWVGQPDYKEFPEFEHATDKRDIPCWSLTSLFGVLPMITEGKYIANPFIAKTSDTEYYVVYATLTKDVDSSGIYDNPIDACCDMIIHLHELNLL